MKLWLITWMTLCGCVVQIAGGGTLKPEDLSEKERRFLSEIRDEKDRQSVLQEWAKMKDLQKNGQKRVKERPLRHDMTSKLFVWLQTKQEVDGQECDKAIDALIALEPSDARSYFYAAQCAFLRGANDKALAILDTVESKFPDAIAPMANLSVKSACLLWRGTIQRYAGDTGAALATYNALESSADPNTPDGRVVSAISALYLAEIASADKDNKAKRIQCLQRIENMKPQSDGKSSDPVDFYNRWASYLHIRESQGTKLAATNLSMPEIPVFFVAIGHLRACGLLPDDLDFTSEQCRIIQNSLYSRVCDSPCSGIDKELYRVVIGFREFTEQKYAEAAKPFAVLFEEDNYFSPIVGLSLAESMNKQNKRDEAIALLDKIAQKYPAYDALVGKKKSEMRQ